VAEHSTIPWQHTSSGKKSPNHENGHGPGCAQSKKKHIAFNTFVEQCIALEKPKTVKPSISRSKSEKSRAKAGLGAYESSGRWNGKTKGLRWVASPDDEEDDDNSSGYEQLSRSSPLTCN
jgi:hypothetical protein